MGYMSRARRDDGIRQAVAARERGRNKVRSATTAVTMASVVTAGALALALPGSAHKTSASSHGLVKLVLRRLGLGLVRYRFGLHRLKLLGLRFHRLKLLGLKLLGLKLLGLWFHELRLELGRPQLRLLSDLEFGRQPGHLRWVVMPHPVGDTATDAADNASAGSDNAPAGSPGGSADASARWRALGTLVQLVVTGPEALAGARRLLADDLAAVDAACSRFRADSEICALTGGRTAGLSPLLAEAIAVALRAARLTDGDVDPTVGAAMSAIGYDRDFEYILPNGPALALTVTKVPGWREIHLDGQSLTMPAGVRLDLGATAKAWAADRSAARIASRLGCGVLVSLGGDIAVAGPAPAGGWRIRVQDVTGAPEDPPRPVRADRHPRRRPGHVEHRRAPLAAGRRRTAPHPRPAHRPARRTRLAYRLGRRRELRRRQRGEHGRGHPRPPGAGLAGAARPAGPAGGRDRRGVHRGRMAG